jgi:YaiO family outer membrane protein
MTARRAVGVMAALAIVCAAGRLDARQTDELTRARALVVSGQRGEAIALLQTVVAASPADSDARVLLGTVLSWDGRYDEARHELDLVLAGSPTHGDALLASINVELWSDHPERAVELTRRGLRQRPADPDYLLARARALIALNRPAEAGDALDRLRAIDPRNAEGDKLRQGMQERLRPWQLRAGSSYDEFSDRRVAWRESHVSVGRETPLGPVSVKGARAQRFGLQDDQLEVEAYPRFRPGTYAYVAAAYAPDAILYPEYRYAVDVYQSLGAGFEGSAGFRRLGFGNGVTIYASSLSKYYGNWLATGRVFVAPHAAGATRSYNGSLRRYLGGAGTYVGVKYGRGAWREELRTVDDFEVLDSDVGGAEATVILRRRFELNLSASYSREDRVERRNVRQYSISTGIGFRF